MNLNHKFGLGFILVFSICCCFTQIVSSKCSKGCDLALASYYLWSESNLTFVQNVMQVSDVSEILAYNPEITNKDLVDAGTRVNVPFSCNCINGEFLGHVFEYKVISGDTYDSIATKYYSNLTNTSSLVKYNSYDANNLPDTGVFINVTVNCYCGDSSISKEYGLFVTYTLRDNESLSSIALAANVSEDLLKKYNPGSDFSAGSGIVFVPGKDKNGIFPPFKSSKGGLAGGAIIGFSIAGVVGALLLAICGYICFFRKKKVKDSKLLSSASEDHTQQTQAPRGSTGRSGGSSLGLSGITVEKSVEFSYEELAKATDNFSLANKIGQGGFGAVYYAELRGEKAAIKKMDMQASKEFLAELKVLTHVHHLNLVRLIGYCVEGSLFLVYEFMENGNLSEHLHEREPLSWSTRVQIALDSARGLEYIHEHTVPVYIHRDIKTANILINTNYHGKVADFGLTKLTEVGGASLNTRLVGTFGYMAPEYAQYGDISPKVDVYAFGVVLYELISALNAIVKISGSTAASADESKGLVGLFEEAFNKADPNEELRKLIDSKLGDNYPFDSVRKMAQLAKACTQENPQLRPSMRSIVVALMTLSSATEDWDVGSFYDNQPLANLMSGR